MPKVFKNSIKFSHPVLDFEKCISKLTDDNTPGMGVLEHCLTVGYVCKALINTWGLKRRFNSRYCLPFIAAGHDVGKICPGFQRKIYGASVVGVPDILNYVDDVYEGLHAVISESEFIDKWFSGIIGAHHGERSHIPLDPASSVYGGTDWSHLRKRLIDILTERFGTPEDMNVSEDMLSMLTAMVVISDWLASDPRYFNQSGNNPDIEKSSLEVVKSLGYTSPSFKRGLSFHDIFGFDPYTAQVEFFNSVDRPGVYIFEDSTGRGKTEAALYAAYHLLSTGQASGLYFGLPTRLTSNSIYDRVSVYLEKMCEAGTAPRLLHGLSWLKKDYIPTGGGLSSSSMWFSSNRRAMLTPFGIGTIDQALLSVIKTKFNFLRKFGLSNKVIILDEVHSYDAYTSTLIEELIRDLRKIGCTVIILSATLTHERRKSLLRCDLTDSRGYPLITVRAGQKSVIKKSSERVKDKRVKVYYHGFCAEDEDRVLNRLISVAVDKASRGYHVLWVVNWVDRSIQIYKKVREFAGSGINVNLGSENVGLIHSRFQAWLRDSLENKWLNLLGKKGDCSDSSQRYTGGGSILITTQIMEQSVDIDADLLITDLAPTDMLIQRIGRLWRHPWKRNGMPVVHIQCPYIPKGINDRLKFHNTLHIHGLVYEPYVLYRSHMVWRGITLVNLPSDTRRLIERTYKDPTSRDPDWIHEEFSSFYERNYEKKLKALGSTGSQMVAVDEETAEECVCHFTRLCNIPTKQFIICKSLTVTPAEIRMTFFSGEEISFLPKERLKYHQACEITNNTIKAPEISACKDMETPDWLYSNKVPVVYGHPIPLVIGDDERARDEKGVFSGYSYNIIHGLYKSKKEDECPSVF